MPKASRLRQLVYLMVLLASHGSFAQTANEPNAAPAIPTETAATTAQPSAEQTAEKPLYSSTQERDNTLLAKANPNEIKWLETTNEKFIALFKAGETRKTKGSLLILHAPETPQLWPAPLESLRRNLPLYGWETMTVPLPQKYPSDTPERDSASQTNSSTEAQNSSTTTSLASSSATESTPSTTQSAATSSEAAKPLLPRAQLITERITAAITELNKNGQFNVIMLVDNSSAPESLAGIFKTTNAGTTNKNIVDGPVQALVLVNLQNQEPLTQEQLKTIFTSPDLPVMDVFFDPDNPYQIEVRRLHRAEAMRSKTKDYQQLVLPPEYLININNKQGFWLEKVRGFMEKKAESTELKK